MPYISWQHQRGYAGREGVYAPSNHRSHAHRRHDSVVREGTRLAAAWTQIKLLSDDALATASIQLESARSASGTAA
jgi:hypothetical protein